MNQPHYMIVVTSIFHTLDTRTITFYITLDITLFNKKINNFCISINNIINCHTIFNLILIK